MEHLFETYYTLSANYNQWWYDVLGTTGVEITQRISCVFLGAWLAWLAYELHELWKLRKLKKEIDEIK